MKKIWKSYGVFTPTAYKIFGLAVIPCIILGLIELFVYANLFSAGISVILFFVYVVWFESRSLRNENFFQFTGSFLHHQFKFLHSLSPPVLYMLIRCNAILP